MTKVKLAGATVNQIPLDWDNNVSNILTAITEARRQKVQILLFPELCITGYGCEDIFLTDWLAEKAWKKLLEIVPACSDITVCVGLPLRISGRTYNGVGVIRNGQILGVALKQNLAREGVHYEPRWFEPWAAGRVIQLERGSAMVPVGDLIFSSAGIQFGFEICEDAWSPNRPGVRLAARNVQLILNPSASHFALGKAGRREKDVVVDGSEKFHCLYLFVNHLGNEAGRMIYDGDIVLGQNGKLLAVNNRLSFRRFNLLACEVDPSNPAGSQHIPIRDDREIPEEFARAGSLALFDYLRKSKARGFVLSLSGGADSACCAVLVSEMVRRGSEELGWKEFWQALGFDPASSPSTVHEAVGVLLTCAYQSTSNSAEATREAARTLAESLGAKFHNWSVEEEAASYRTKIEQALQRKLTWDADDIALQNIQARSRSPVIWLLANLKQSILLTTSNRSEGDVGYATMDGDTSGSLAPLAGIDKPFILSWLRWAETGLKYTGLKNVNLLEPTAELRPSERSQTDEKDLMPYAVLVSIERMAVFERKTPAEIFRKMSADHQAGTLKGWIRKYFTLWSSSQWKRERFAPSFHFDDYNIDPRSGYRFPILSGAFLEELKEMDALK